ncbi:MAG: CDP-alcohol phosphatidyltransferase family protein [Planctomycetota bacterium]
MKPSVKTLTALPTLVTLGNTFCGFLAMTYVLEATSSIGWFQTEAWIERLAALQESLRALPADSSAQQGSLTAEINGLLQDREDARTAFYSYMVKGVWAMFIAMVFDFMDGKVARMTKSESAFGVQIDSLSDVLSFGLFPALAFKALYEFEFGATGKISLILGSFYLIGAVLRLARFNVEAEHEDDDHRAFRGLPSPAAAASVAAMVYLYCSREWAEYDGFIRILLPWMTAAAGILMWTKLPYIHFVNVALTERRNFAHLFLVLVAIGVVFYEPPVGIAVIVVGYLVSGPLVYVWDLFRGRTTVDGESLI